MLNHVRKKYSIFASGILALLLSFSVFSHAYALSSYSSVSSINSGSLLSQPIRNATNLNEHDDDDKQDDNKERIRTVTINLETTAMDTIRKKRKLME